MKLKKSVLEALQSEITGCLKPGDEIVMVGCAGLLGTVMIAEKEYEKLKQSFSYGFLKDAIALREKYGIQSDVTKSEVWNIIEKGGASALYALSEGGFLSGLWKMAEASQVGLQLDLRKIPIRQETIEICEVFDINPYKLKSDGAILFGIQGGESMVLELRRMGYMAEVIGQTNKGNDRLLYSGENVRYLERPARDEIYKII